MNFLENVDPKIKEPLQLFVGTLLFVLGVNLFIVPVGLYNGGIVGISQIIRTLITKNIHLNFDIAGIINMMFNIPLLIIAYKGISKKFFKRTLVALILQTIFFTFIKIPTVPLLDDRIASIVIGGVISGMGSGIVLQSGASGGGLDIIGVYTSIKKPGASVGGLIMSVNFFIYVACAILFDFRIALYSIIYAVISTTAVDKFHYQNIEISLIIFTKVPEVKQEIMQKYVRGVTYWEGIGAYTNNKTEVLVTVCSKIEVNRIKKDILKLDPKAFVIMNTTNVTGGFERRLA